MIALVVKVKAKTGELAGLREAAVRMSRAVTMNEPGNALFAVGDGPDEDTIIIMERYRDEQAMEDHRGMPHFKEVGREMGRFMDGKPEVLYRFVEHQ